MNKLAKDFLEHKFEQWYANEVTKQLEGAEDLDSVDIQPVDMHSAAMKVLTAKWLVEMAVYVSDNPQIVVKL